MVELEQNGAPQAVETELLELEQDGVSVGRE